MPLLMPGDKCMAKDIDKTGMQDWSNSKELSRYVPIYLPGSEIMDFASKPGYTGGSGSNAYTDFKNTHMEVGFTPKSPHNHAAISIRTQKINVDHVDYFYIAMTSVYMHGDYSFRDVRFYSDPNGEETKLYNGPNMTGGLLTVDARSWTGDGYLHVGAKQSESDVLKRYPYWFGISHMWVVFDDGAKGVF